MSVPLPPGYHAVTKVGFEANPGDFSIQASPLSPRRGVAQFDFLGERRFIYGLELALWVTLSGTPNIRIIIFRPDAFSTYVWTGYGGGPGDTDTGSDIGSGSADNQMVHISVGGNLWPQTGAPWSGEVFRPGPVTLGEFSSGAQLEEHEGGWWVWVEDQGAGAGGAINRAELTFIVKDTDGSPGVSNSTYDFGVTMTQGRVADDPVPRVLTPGDGLYSALHVNGELSNLSGVFPVPPLPLDVYDRGRFQSFRLPHVDGAPGNDPTLHSVFAYLDGGGSGSSATLRAAVFNGDDGTLVARSNPITVNSGDAAAWREFTFTTGLGSPLPGASSTRNRHDGFGFIWGLYWVELETTGDPVARVHAYPTPANLVRNAIPASASGTPPNYAITGGHATLGHWDPSVGGVVWKGWVSADRSSNVPVGDYIGIITDKVLLEGEESTYSFGVGFQTQGTNVGSPHTNSNRVDFLVNWYDNSDVLVHTDTVSDAAQTGFVPTSCSLTQAGLSVPATATKVALEVRWYPLSSTGWTAGATGDTAKLSTFDWMATPGSLPSITYAELQEIWGISAPFPFRSGSTIFTPRSYGIDPAAGPFKALAGSDPVGYEPSTPAFLKTGSPPSSLPTSGNVPLVEKPLAFIRVEDDTSLAPTPPPPPGPPTGALPSTCMAISPETVITHKGQVVDVERETYTDFWYGTDLESVGNVDESLFFINTNAVQAGELASITATFWARSGDPEWWIGYFAAGVFVDDTSSWTALPARRRGDFWVKTWYKVFDAAAITLYDGEVDFFIRTDGALNLTSPGVDGGQVWGLRWTDAEELTEAYCVTETAATTHTPPTSDTSVANFIVGGPIDAQTFPLSAAFPTLVGSSGPSTSRFAETLDDTHAPPIVGDTELFATGVFQPAAAGPIGYWTTPQPMDTVLYGLRPTPIVDAPSPGLVVPDDDPDNPVYIDFDFTGVEGNITDMSISLWVEHTFVADLGIALFAPGVPNTNADPYNVAGESLDLLDGNGGGGTDFGTGTGDDEAIHITNHADASMPYTNLYAPWAGDGFLPEGSTYGEMLDFSTFFGMPVSGVWRLRFQDFAGGDEGRVMWARMCVTLDTGEVIGGFEPASGGDTIDSRRSFLEYQRLLQHHPAERVGTAEIGWHGTVMHPEQIALVRIGGPWEYLVGEIVHIIYRGRDIYEYIYASSDVPHDITIPRRAFLALELPSATAIQATLEVVGL